MNIIEVAKIWEREPGACFVRSDLNTDSESMFICFENGGVRCRIAEQGRIHDFALSLVDLLSDWSFRVVPV